MHRSQSNDPLHGVTLKALLTELVDQLGWEELSKRINLNCFTKDPSINSSLKFLRKTPWARDKVEKLYIQIKSQNKTTSTKSNNDIWRN